MFHVSLRLRIKVRVGSLRDAKSQVRNGGEMPNFNVMVTVMISNITEREGVEEGVASEKACRYSGNAS